MLVRFTTNKGEDVWVNPIYVRLLTRKRKHTEIVMSQSSLSTHGVVRIDAPMEDVAALLNDAMPPMNYLPDIDDAGDDASSTTVPGMF
ncbi:MAG: hypothetical protein EA379_08350 [Phycisphaerales bacterium]|nr:MAG: hypothetical protein EA379_08350 [Phycisphaerales bacterium]